MLHPGRPRLVYVEFGDEEAMRAGLEKHAEVCYSFSFIMQTLKAMFA